MDAKHDPLPWVVMGNNVVADNGEGEVVCSNGRGGNVQVFLDIGYANIDYIVQAANAYPKLVEALLTLTAVLDHIHQSMPVHRCTIDCPDIGKHVLAARAVLAESEGKP